MSSEMSSEGRWRERERERERIAHHLRGRVWAPPSIHTKQLTRPWKGSGGETTTGMEGWRAVRSLYGPAGGLLGRRLCRSGQRQRARERAADTGVARGGYGMEGVGWGSAERGRDWPAGRGKTDRRVDAGPESRVSKLATGNQRRLVKGCRRGTFRQNDDFWLRVCEGGPLSAGDDVLGRVPCGEQGRRG
jgi:hypothetical protein